MTALQLAEALRAKQLSAEEALTDHLAQLDAWEPALGAVLTRCDARALDAARDIDQRRAQGQPLGLLAGLPVGVKDVVSTKGVRTTCGSKMLDGYIPPYDATVMRKLQGEDAILLCKLNMDEFAMGSSTENSAFFPAKNPHDLGRVPGGSSGGSAACVAAGLAPLALGSDTGGSIRQPAAYCGVVGLKPTYGRVSRYGLIAFASSLDQLGPMARSVSDCALLLQAMAGYDLRDSTSAPRGVPSYVKALQGDLKGKVFGVPKECAQFEGDYGPGVAEAFQTALRTLSGLGAEVREISLPSLPHALPTYYLIATAEASANLARFDGVRYGHRAQPVEALGELYEKSRAEGFGPEVKRRIMLGTYALSAGYYDAYYKKAQEVRALISRDYQRAFESVDFVATPTAPSAAFPLGAKTADPLSMYLADIFTIPCNLAGLPGISVPAGKAPDGLPLGLQLVGRHFQEEALLSAAYGFERATGGPAPLAKRPARPEEV